MQLTGSSVNIKGIKSPLTIIVINLYKMDSIGYFIHTVLVLCLTIIAN